MDVSLDEVFESADRLIAGLLERFGVVAPPVDALRIAEDHLGLPVEYMQAGDDHSPAQRRRSRGVLLHPGMTQEQQQRAAAQAVAHSLLPNLLRKLDIQPELMSKSAIAHLRSTLAMRLLIPTKMFRAAYRACRTDVPALRDIFSTATPEAVAMRLLDLENPCIVAIVDDRVVSVRRGNTRSESKKLTSAEQQCLERVMKIDQPHRLCSDGWTARGWPIPHPQFRRVILHAVPNDV